MLNVFELTYILVCYKQCSQLASNIMCTSNMPADIYPSPLQAVQPISWEYYVHSNHVSWHISWSTASSAANQLGILCMLQSCQLIYILVCYKWCSQSAGNIIHTPIMPLTYILVHYKWCSRPTGNIMHSLNMPADTHCLLISPGPDQVTPPISIAGTL